MIDNGLHPGGTIKRDVADGTITRGSATVTTTTISSAVKHRIIRFQSPRQIEVDKEIVIANRGCLFLPGEDVAHGDILTAADGRDYKVIYVAPIPDATNGTHHLEAAVEEVT